MLVRIERRIVLKVIRENSLSRLMSYMVVKENPSILHVDHDCNVRMGNVAEFQKANGLTSED